MVTSIFYNGRIVSVPGAYSSVDASALEQVGLSASGVVAVIGTAEGGIPVSALQQTSDIQKITAPQQANVRYRSGDLLEVMNMLFAPSNDPGIPGGAQQVVPLKVNPATQASVTLTNANGNSLVLTSKDWGAFTSQINVSVATGSQQGKLLTTQFENVVESVDNLGGSAVGTLQYLTTSTSWTTMVAGAEADGSLHARGARTIPALGATITTLGTPSQVSVTATAGDAGKVIVLFGTTAAGVTREEVTLVNGAAPSVNTWTSIVGLYVKTAPTAGTVTLNNVTGSTTMATITVGNQTAGSALWAYGWVANATVQIAASAPTTASIIIEGVNASGTTVRESLALNGTTPVQTANQYSRLMLFACAGLASGITLSVSALAARADANVQKTIQKVADYFNSKGAVVTGSPFGFVFNIVGGQNSATMPASALDATPADVDVVAAPLSFKADLYAIANWINTNSQLIKATIPTGAQGAPSNTSSPVFLTGGTEGVSTFQQYQNALNWLKRVRVNSIVVLSTDPAVAAALDAHCAFMCGVGRSERDGFVGLANAAGTDVPSKTELKTQIQALNTKNLRCCPQRVKRYDSKGNLTEFNSSFTAALAAGMQAGAPVGTSLTFKYVNAVSFRQDASWNPVDDAEELVNSGALFMQQIDGQGLRWVRNVTAFLQSANIAYIEGGVNAAINYATYNFRTALEFAVGRPGFAGTINAIRGAAITALGLLVNSNVLTTWRALDIQVAVDVAQVSVQMAPIIPINFVPIVIHLVTVPQSGNPQATS